MVEKCPNCGRPMLPSDTRCFHCNVPVLGRELPIEESNENRINPAVLRYALTVVVLMILGILLINWMGAGFDETVDAAAATSGPPGWQEYIPPEQNYRVWLPPDWEVFTPLSSEWPDLLARIPLPQPNSFGRLAPTRVGNRMTMIAQSPPTDLMRPMYVSVQLHSGLVHYSLLNLQLDDWSDRGILIETQDRLDLSLREETEEPALTAALHYPRRTGDGTWQTITMLTQTGSGVYAITVSATGEDFGSHQDTLRTILEHFHTRDFLRALDVR